MVTRSTRLAGWFGLVLALAWPVPAWTAPAPLAATPPVAAEPELLVPQVKRTSEKGFFDDPMAIDPGASRAAVIRTDSATFAEVDVIDLETGKTTLTFPIGDAQQLPEQLIFAPEGKGLVLVSRDSATGKRTAQFFDAAGKPAGSAGPVTALAPALLGGERILVAMDERNEGKGSVFTVTAHRLDGLARIGKPRAHKVAKDGAVAGTPMKLVSWQAGYLRMDGLVAGGYDKKKDARVPDRAAVFDTLEGKVVGEVEIADLMGWAVLAKMRKERENRSAFMLPSDDERGLDLIDPAGRRAKVKLAVPWELYDPTTLREQEGPEGGVLYFTLGVDPVNRPALKRQKADKPSVDVYSVYLLNNNEVTHRGRLPGIDDRPVAWVAGYGRLVLLRKHKGFSRGGRDIEIYALH